MTNRRSRNPVDSRRTNAAITARSAQSRRGFALPLRSTATSSQSTSNSTSFHADERPSNTSRPTSRRKTRYNTRSVPTGAHALPATCLFPQVRRLNRFLEPHRCGCGDPERRDQNSAHAAGRPGTRALRQGARRQGWRAPAQLPPRGAAARRSDEFPASPAPDRFRLVDGAEVGRRSGGGRGHGARAACSTARHLATSRARVAPS